MFQETKKKTFLRLALTTDIFSCPLQIEGMTQINGLQPVKIKNTTNYGFTLELDTQSFSAYAREGLVSRRQSSSSHMLTRALTPLLRARASCYLRI